MANRRGRIYLRGKTWWLQYSHNGTDRRESAGSTSRTVAEKLLTQRMAGKDAGTLVETTLRRLHFSDLQHAIEAEYALNRRKSLDRLQDAFKALATMFDGWLTTAITDARLREYANARLTEGMAHATVRYELAVFKRSFKLAKLPCPSFPSIQVDNARQGFFEKPDFERVLTHLPEYLRPIMTFAYYTGWRTISEVLPLQWKQIDWQAGMIRLEPGVAKNKRGRMFPFQAFPGLAEVLKTQWEATQQVMVSQQRICPWVFFRVMNQQVVPILSYKTAWAKAVRLAGVPSALCHDFRRTAVRNLRRAGVSQTEAMKLTGHLTISVFQRYDIVDEADLCVAVEKLAKFHAQVPLRDNYGTIEPIRAGVSVQRPT